MFPLQQFLHSLTQFKRSGIDHPRRNLFATDFKQKIWHLENLHSCGVRISIRRPDSRARALTVSSLAFGLLSYRFFLLRHFCRLALLLLHIRLRNPNGERTHSRNHSHTLGHRNRAASIQNVEQVRALQAKIVGGKDRKTLFVLPPSITSNLLPCSARHIDQAAICILLHTTRSASMLFRHRLSRSCTRKTAAPPPAAHRHKS